MQRRFQSTMVSVDFSTPPASPKARNGRHKLVASCRVLLILAGCVALMKIAKNGSQMGQLLSLDAADNINKPLLRSLRQDYGSECRYYLAESAIPNGGLGVFTANGILPNQQVGMNDLCIMVEHLPSHDDTHLRSHTWGSANVFGQFEVSKKGRAKAACEGLGTLYNAAPYELSNTDKGTITTHTNGGLSRTTHAGAGAISHYFGMTGVARDLITAGSELTVDYGDWDFQEDEVYVKPKRSVEWLRQHGMCVDNIEVQGATNPEMGRGAFATRRLPKGTLVSPAPLELTKSRSAFEYDAKSEPEPLFVNYNYNVGDMLLFPYGPGVNLINHSSQSPNVGLRWSSSKFHHAEWLELNKEELWEQATPGGLILEVVALRDILPGEELFMDYGRDWETAWNKHVQEWKPILTGDYVYPADMDETGPLLTVGEQEKNPYPPNLMTVCQTPDDKRKKHRTVEWYEKYEFPFRMAVCHILERMKDEHGDLVYTVALDWDGYEFDKSIPMKKRYIDLKVPRKAIRFVDKPNMSDQHLPNAFRHPIELPKEMVPEQWKTEL